MSGLTVGNLPVVCGAVAATCIRSVLRRETLLPHQLAVNTSWRRERKPIPPIIGAADTPKRSCRKGRHRGHPKQQRERCSQTSSPQVCPLQRRSAAVRSTNSVLRNHKLQWQVHLQENYRVYWLLYNTKKIGQSVEARNVNSEPLDNMLRVDTAVQQIMTELSGAVSEEAKIVAITKIVLSLMKQNGH
jgi:hypothetical protein